jgi:two-component system sensor histidine kinase BaeS
VRRSLLLRLLVLSLSVASLSVVATALLATYGTGSGMRAEASSRAGLLEIDSGIRSALLAYADEHRSWDGVDALVRELAERTGRRIALTAADGTEIADSARVGGFTAHLPPAPAARIDAAAPRPVSAARAVNPALTLHTTAARRVWQLSEQERRERRGLADAAAACLRGAGIEATFRIEAVQQVVTAAPGVSELRTHPCVPEELFAPSTAARELAARTAELAAACLDRQGVSYAVASDAGLPIVVPGRAGTACLDAAAADAKRPDVAPPADLHLGTGDRFDPFAPDGWWRTGTTAAGVVLVAVVVTVLVGRRLLRPVRALTAAAVRMEAGDRTVRVPVEGDDEVTRLAGAFNAMAASIERGDRQREAMVGDVAHELRSPLANVRALLEAAEDGVLPLDVDLVRSLLEECGLLARLVADLQELAMAESGTLRVHPEERDAADLAAQAVAAHRARAEAAGVAIRLHAPEPVPVLADPARMRQAVGNLVGNAVTHAGSVVEVSVRACGESALLTVGDDGPGIGPEHLPHVFDRFYRADPSRTRRTGGSGLGLAITRHLVEAHGGAVEVASTPGLGSVFTIRLPNPVAARDRPG